ncbi:hypothetical protein BCR41DRAFT_373581 [Lobosporangium transversale]|uniref:Uncharacterized protein n=1 Tax=Lobosporangium transversale TaxID=64571 RepID=A0A1Y2GFB9_9FUNG|nr:hypothetical protein BCR41DRAFT_373581 [Lobosporangium transversale]ORZ07494.1 hypothetical protein BCR41DRAFT_373581 [Lobosporangium transversale]|eukprot:XP_021878001.1 hypothetical protein BCR41DRAFT_373581 [Lobosporangium transversale]
MSNGLHLQPAGRCRLDGGLGPATGVSVDCSRVYGPGGAQPDHLHVVRPGLSASRQTGEESGVFLLFIYAQLPINTLLPIMGVKMEIKKRSFWHRHVYMAMSSLLVTTQSTDCFDRSSYHLGPFYHLDESFEIRNYVLWLLVLEALFKPLSICLKKRVSRGFKMMLQVQFLTATRHLLMLRSAFQGHAHLFKSFFPWLSVTKAFIDKAMDGFLRQ